MDQHQTARRAITESTRERPDWPALAASWQAAEAAVADANRRDTEAMRLERYGQ